MGYGTVLYCFLSFHRYLFSMGLFLVVTIAFLKGHSVARYVRSLAPLTSLTRSAALRFATLASLARFVHELAHSLHSLPCGRLKFMNLCSRRNHVSREQSRFLSLLETHPMYLHR